ncbi:Rod shape-determining protein MreD [Candidatus Electronema halotolerans]|jgi:rod shape-determining protein MreD
MLTLVFIIMGLLLAVAQTTVFMPSPLWRAAPDLYYVLVAYAAYQFPICQSIAILLPLSCVMDVYSGTVTGLHPAICCGGYFFLKFMAVKMPVRKSLYQLPLTAVSYLFVSWLEVLLLKLLLPEAEIVWSWPPMLFRASLVYLAAFPLFRCFAFVSRRLSVGLLPGRTRQAHAGNQFRQERGLP